MSAIFEANGIDEAALVGMGRRFAAPLAAGGVVYLRGELGVGKTTFARALLQALGVGERVKSPTYSLVESYRSGELRVHHLDLYRIADADELEWLGLEDMVDGPSLIVVEWPDRGLPGLPPADLEIELRHAGDRRDLRATAQGRIGDRVLGEVHGGHASAEGIS
jgi:tRNA threonylcarbamoyladenosine biosynthesis protein TsaE